MIALDIVLLGIKLLSDVKRASPIDGSSVVYSTHVEEPLSHMQMALETSRVLD